MKKIIKIILSVLCIITLASCNLSLEDRMLPEYESTYFKYAVETNKDGTKIGYLIGFTELGLNQKALVLPNELDGIKIAGIGYRLKLFMFGEEVISDFKSETLEKMFINMGEDDYPKWNMSHAHGQLPNCLMYYITYNKSVRLGIIKGQVSNFFDYIHIANFPKTDHTYISKIANVTYLYHYENAPNEGYYWIDSYNNETIDFILPDPTRAGYAFDGWHKDQNLNFLWDFDHDLVGDEIIIDHRTIDTYLGSTLYAKWIKI